MSQPDTLIVGADKGGDLQEELTSTHRRHPTRVPIDSSALKAINSPAIQVVVLDGRSLRSKDFAQARAVVAEALRLRKHTIVLGAPTDLDLSGLEAQHVAAGVSRANLATVLAGGEK